MNSSRVVKYIAIGTIALLLGALSGWYFYLRDQSQTIADTAAGRGLGIGVPSFSGATGSTLRNIIYGISGSETDNAAQERPVVAPPRLWHTHVTPIAGFGFMRTGTTTLIRFMERSTGNIFDADLETGEVTRITNTLIPAVHEAAFSKDGRVAARAEDAEGTVEAFTGIVSTTTASSTPDQAALVRSLLGDGVLEVIPSYTGQSLLSLLEDGAGSALVRSSIRGSEPERLFASAIKGWDVTWLPDNRILLQEKSASGVPSSAFELSPQGTLISLARNVPGLTLLPRASSTALLIGSDNGGLTLSIRSRDDARLIPLPIQTIAKKCAWSPDPRLLAYCAAPLTAPAPFLDNWHRGLIRTADIIWRIDAATGTTERVVSLEEESDTRIDVENPRIDPLGTYFAFQNAHDKSLWVLRLSDFGL